MGLVYADIEIVNADDLALVRKGYLKAEQIKKMTVKALADSGAHMLVINEGIRPQLDLSTLEEQIAELADGSKLKIEIVGPVEVRFENRSTTCRAMVLLGDAEVLLGAIPLEDLDVLIDARQQRLIVNPASPYFAKKSLK
jgi:clan AA aspartic protease